MQLPDWSGLLRRLRGTAGLPPSTGRYKQFLDEAEEAIDRLGASRFAVLARDPFQVDQHTLAHGLLASLGVEQVVTTNYDNAYELAHAGRTGDPSNLRVLTCRLPTPGNPWIQKLHGDVQRPEGIVLSRVHYARLREYHGLTTATTST